MATWDQLEPTLHDGGLTLLNGSTFAITDAYGEIRGEPQGFFVADRRVVNRLRFHIEGRQLMPLRVTRIGEDEVSVVRRAMPLPDELGQPPLLVSYKIDVTPGRMHLRLLLRNTGFAARPADWSLQVGGDFADIFAVKEGRVDLGDAPPTARVSTDSAQLSISSDAITLVATASGTANDVEFTEDGIRENLVLPPGHTAERVVTLEVWSDGAPLVATTTAPAQDEPLPPQLWTRSAHLRAVLETSAEDLTALRIHDPQTGEDAIAAGAPWFMTLFGRDSLLSIIMAAGWDRDLGIGVLRSLAVRQGRRVDLPSEEEPGRILHETRMGAASSLFEGKRHRYYGSTDSTPLFVVALAEAVRHGLAPGVARPLLDNADACLRWIEEYGDLDGDGFVESAPRGIGGLVNQGWKDSWNAIVDGTGRIVPPPYCLIEVQAYTYAALRARAYLARVLDAGDPTTWESAADRLRLAIDGAFWLPELETYALALGPDKEPLRTSTSNAGHMLWTGAALPVRVPTLVRTLMARDLRTHWGLRTLSAEHPAYDAFGYHLGSIWPHDTALVAWGLSRWGAARPCRELSEALVRTSTHFHGALPELIAGTEVGDVIAGSGPLPFPTACSPQAWAAAAPLLMLRSVLGLEVDLPRRVVHLNGAVPEEWLPLTLHQVWIGGRRITVRADPDGVTVKGLPDDVRIVSTPWFDS